MGTTYEDWLPEFPFCTSGTIYIVSKNIEVNNLNMDDLIKYNTFVG
jgi:hypothetical protein